MSRSPTTPANSKEIILRSNFDVNRTHTSTGSRPWQSHRARWLIAGLLTLVLGVGLLAQTVVAAPRQSNVARADIPIASFAQTMPGPAYPLKLSANGRYLVDQNNAPFMIVGDSPQAMVGNLSVEDADFFLSNRQKYSFNTVWVN